MQNGLHAATATFGNVLDDRWRTSHPGPPRDRVKWGLGGGPSTVLGGETDTCHRDRYRQRGSTWAEGGITRWEWSDHTLSSRYRSSAFITGASVKPNKGIFAYPPSCHAGHEEGGGQNTPLLTRNVPSMKLVTEPGQLVWPAYPPMAGRVRRWLHLQPGWHLPVGRGLLRPAHHGGSSPVNFRRRGRRALPSSFSLQPIDKI